MGPTRTSVNTGPPNPPKLAERSSTATALRPARIPAMVAAGKGRNIRIFQQADLHSLVAVLVDDVLGRPGARAQDHHDQVGVVEAVFLAEAVVPAGQVAVLLG